MGAQTAADPLENLPATIEDTDGDPNRVLVAADNCTVGPGAIVRVQDPDGTQVDLVDDDNVQITATATGITIVGTGTNQNIVAQPVTGQEGGVPGFDPGTGSVESSTGITCDDATTNPEVPKTVCPRGASEVDTFTSDDTTATGDDTTFGPFRVSGEDFQVLYAVEDEDQTVGGGTFRVVVRRGGDTVSQSAAVTTAPADGTVEDDGEGPGTFRLDVKARGVVFSITVCEGTDDAGGGEGEDEDLNCDDFDSQVAAQANLDDNPDDPNNLDVDDDGDACEDFPFGNALDDEDDDDLPDTGGAPLTLLAGLCLILASSALVRTVRRG